MTIEERYEAAYKLHKKEFEMRRPRPTPVNSGSKVIGRLIWKATRWSFTAAGMLVSATHTVPLIQSTIQENFSLNLGLFSIGKEGFGWAGFIMLEGFALMIAHKLSKRYKIPMYIELVAVALIALAIVVANFYGSFFEGTAALSKTNSIVYEITTVVSKLLMAFVAPVVVFISGMYEASSSEENHEKDKADREVYNLESSKWDEDMNQAWFDSNAFKIIERTRTELNKRSAISVVRESEPALPASVQKEEQSVQESFKPKELEFVRWYLENKTAADGMTTRELKDASGISVGTISSARKKFDKGVKYD